MEALFFVGLIALFGYALWTQERRVEQRIQREAQERNLDQALIREPRSGKRNPFPDSHIWLGEGSFAFWSGNRVYHRMVIVSREEQYWVQAKIFGSYFIATQWQQMP